MDYEKPASVPETGSERKNFNEPAAGIALLSYFRNPFNSGAEAVSYRLLFPRVDTRRHHSFSCVYGIAINLHFPVLNWENEISIVKQSTASLLGFAGAFLLTALCLLLLYLSPKEYTLLLKLLLCLLIPGATALLHKKICRPSAWQRYQL